MDSISISGIIGFIMGFGLVLALALYQWRKGKKERRYDERYENVHAKARSASWSIMVVAIFTLLLGSVIYEGLKLAAILLISLYATILISYWMAVVVYNKRI